MKYVFKKNIYTFLAATLDMAGYAFFWFFRRKPGPVPAPQNILLIRLDHLGDVLYSTAVPKLLKTRFPRSLLICLVSSYAAPLFSFNPYIDETWIYDPSWFSKNRYRKSPDSLSFGALIRRMKEKKIDTAIGLRGDLRENVMMFLASIRERIGFGITGGGFLLTRKVFYRRGVHMSEHTLDLVRSMGLEATKLEAALYFSEAEDEVFKEKLSQWGLAGRPFICLQTEAGYSSKEWPLDSLKDFLGRLKTQFPDYRIALIGVHPQKGAFLSAAFPDVADLTGKISIRELCLLIRNASFFIGYDSGPSYIASTLGVPTLFLYSGTNIYEEWKPLQEASAVIRKNPPCAPCAKEVCDVAGHPCMSGITPQEALDAVKIILSRSLS